MAQGKVPDVLNMTAMFLLPTGETVGQIVASAKNFSTGSRGFFGIGKVVLADGKKYQCQVQMVEIGSKPK